MLFKLDLRHFHVALFFFLGTFHLQVYDVMGSGDSISSVVEGVASGVSDTKAWSKPETCVQVADFLQLNIRLLRLRET